MKFYIAGNYHHKNMYFLKKTFEGDLVDSIDQADVIFAPNRYINTDKYPKKFFIFGPHFSVFPNNVTRKLSNNFKNSIYIQPSQPSVDTWQKEFNFSNLPMKAIPFGVDTDKFKPGTEKNNVILYYKQRDPSELNFLTNFLKNNNIKNLKIFRYGSYKEEDYLRFLQKSKYMIVLGRHESQGFAIEEAMSCDVPLLVWGVSLRKQEFPYKKEYVNVKSRVSTVPYWDKKCGELFHKKEELSKTFEKFISNLENYKPREYIMENLSFEKCSERFKELINILIKYPEKIEFLKKII